MRGFWTFFLRKESFSFLLIVVLIIVGGYSLINIPKESAPEVQVPIAIVSTFLPGASAVDIEELITNKVESALDSLDDLNKLTSTSKESISVVVAEFNASADIDKSVQEVKDEVDKIKSELPSEAEDPFVSEVDFVDQPILLVSIASELPIPSLIKLADDTIDELEEVSGVSRVEKSGIAEKETQVVVDKEQLHKFGLALNDVVRAISATNASIPVGSITTNDIEYSVGFKGDIDDPSEIADIAILNRSGQPIYIRDIAFVSDGVSKPTTFSRISINGQPSQQAVSLSIFKRKGGDITKVSGAVKNKLNTLQKNGFLKNSQVLVALDSGDYVKQDLRSLSLTGLQTVILVMLILFLAIGWKEALIAGLAIPLSFLIAFIGLDASGNTINFISLFSLILAIGILVDSAIVVTEGVHTKTEQGLEKKEAACATIKEFQWPLMSGTLTTIVIFIPLFFLSGVTGEFIDSIPFTILFVLTASIFVALGIIPLVASKTIGKNHKKKTKLGRTQERYTQKLKAWHEKNLQNFVGHRKKENRLFLVITIIFILSFALPSLGIVKTIFFPQEDADFVFLELEKVEGTPLSQTDLGIRTVEEFLYQENQIESFVTTVGAGSSFTGGGSSGSKVANITIILSENRKHTSTEIIEDLREKLSVITDSTIRIQQPSSGPPVGSPVAIKFFAEDLDELNESIAKGEALLKSIPGTAEVDSSISKDSVEFSLSIDKAKATALGLNSLSIAQTLRTAVNGTIATTIKTPDEDIDVVVKLNLNPDYTDPHETSDTTIDSLLQLEINSLNGPVLLGSIASAEIKKSNASISHEDRDRIATISSQVEEGFFVSKIVEEFLERESELNLPDSVRISIGGEDEESAKTFKEMFIALIMGVLLVLTVLILQFNSFRQAFFIIIIVPLSLIGIMFGLAITGKELSFPSILGYIALSGIVVNNAIILIDKMNNLRREDTDRPIKDIAIEASVSRLRPILLTTITTVIGIIPLTYASAIWGPLAYSIIFGLTFATATTVLLIPILYNRWPGKLPR